MKYLSEILFCGVMIMFCTAAYFYWELSLHHQDRCDYIEALANNPKIVSALDQWLADNIVGKGYYLVSGQGGRIAAHRGDDVEIHYIPLPDNEITGIEDLHLRFRIIKHESTFNDPIIDSNINALHIGRGRDTIIITKNDHTISSYRDSNLESRNFKKIDDSVYAYCSSGRFKA